MSRHVSLLTGQYWQSCYERKVFPYVQNSLWGPWGQSASYFVLLELDRWGISEETVPWVGSALDFDRHPIIYRDWKNPPSNAVFGPIYRALGGERNIRAT